MLLHHNAPQRRSQFCEWACTQYALDSRACLCNNYLDTNEHSENSNMVQGGVWLYKTCAKIGFIWCMHEPATAT